MMVIQDLHLHTVDISDLYFKYEDYVHFIIFLRVHCMFLLSDMTIG